MKKPNQTRKPLWWDSALYRNSLAALSIDSYACKLCLPAAQTHKLNALQVPGEDCNLQTDRKKNSLILLDKCKGVVLDYEQTLKNIHIRIALVMHHSLRVQSTL